MAASDLVTPLGTAKFGTISSTRAYFSSSTVHYRQQADSISAAHDFYRMLDDDDSEPEVGTTSGPRQDRNKELIEVHKIPLVRDAVPAATDKGNARCSNAATRPDHWKKDPRFRFTPTRGQVGFQSQISFLCYKAQLVRCKNVSCQKMWDKMNKSAPPCQSWPEFREWAVTAMSCQASMRATKDSLFGTLPPHTHIARAVSGCCMILRDCLPGPSQEEGASLGMWHAPRPYMPDAQDDRGPPKQPPKSNIDVHDVAEVLYWMTTTQYNLGIGPGRFGRWGSKLLPDLVAHNSLNRAQDMVESLHLEKFCKARIWSLVEVCDRKEADLIGVVTALLENKGLQHGDAHKRCMANRCQTDYAETTSVKQLHKCNEQKKCPQPLVIDMLSLEDAVEKNTSTAWCFKEKAGMLVLADLSKRGEPYMAVSHVWADGTGGGLNPGTVNTCLFDYFARIAADNGCQAIWWDTISVPSGKGRNKALQTMHVRYAEAKFTLVHDKYLLGVKALQSEARCLGVVLSTWFTRGWTALELAKSKNVGIIFGPETNEIPKPVPLDEILVEGPEECTRAHWMASSSIRRLQGPVDDLGDLISILRPRATSRVLDRTTIALNLAEVPDAFFDADDGEAAMTMELLKYLGRIPQNCLLHGKPTINATGEFSWCPGNLDELPAPPTQTDMESQEAGETMSMLQVSIDGVVSGEWWCHDLTPRSKTAYDVSAYGTDRSSAVKIQLALHEPNNCLLLSPAASAREDAALLAMPLKVTRTSVDCRYIGTVTVGGSAGLKPADINKKNGWHLLNVSFGIEDNHEQPVLSGRTALIKAHDFSAPGTHSCLSCADGWAQAGMDETTKLEDRSLSSDRGSQFVELVRLSELLIPQPSPELSKVASRQPTREQLLLQAVKSGREKAIQHLVNQDVHLEQKDLKGLRAEQQTVCGLWALGSVYITKSETTEMPEQDKAATQPHTRSLDDLNQATMVFSRAIELCKGLGKTTEGGESWLLPQLQLNYGRLLSVAIAKDQRARAPKEFAEVFSACRPERRIKTLSEDQYRVRKQLRMRNLQHTNRRLDRSGPPSFRSVQHMTVEDDEFAGFEDAWDRTDEGWERLKWDVLAEQVLWRVEAYQYEEAASLFTQTLVEILANGKTGRMMDDQSWNDPRVQEIQVILAHNEVFHKNQQRVLLNDMANRMGDQQDRRNKYMTALMWFYCQLPRDHLLVSLTRLHLGANLALGGDWTQAEKYLRQALEAFEIRLAWHCEYKHDHHHIVAFTQYHLGMTVGRLGEYRQHPDMIREAVNLLGKSRKSFGVGTSKWMMDATQRALKEVTVAEEQLPGLRKVQPPTPALAPRGKEGEKGRARTQQMDDETQQRVTSKVGSKATK